MVIKDRYSGKQFGLMTWYCLNIRSDNVAYNTNFIFDEFNNKTTIVWFFAELYGQLL